MPGSLLGLTSRLKRADSNLSDKSDNSVQSTDSKNSARKVSFNKAVRVKKYPTRKGENNKIGENNKSEDKKFWFKVFKGNRSKSPDYGDQNSYVDNTFDFEFLNEDGDLVRSPDPLDTIEESDRRFDKVPPPSTTMKYESVFSTQNNTSSALRTPGLILRLTEAGKLHQSQLPPDPPPVSKNHVLNIVHKFNEESAWKKRFGNDEDLPPEPPVDYEKRFGSSMSSRADERINSRNFDNFHRSRADSGLSSARRRDSSHDRASPNRWKHQKDDVIIRRVGDNGEVMPRSVSPQRFVEEWDGGDHLVADDRRNEETTTETKEGRHKQSLDERSRVWKHNKVTKVYEDMPVQKSEKKTKSRDEDRYLTNGSRAKSRGSSEDRLYSQKYSGESSPYMDSKYRVEGRKDQRTKGVHSSRHGRRGHMVEPCPVEMPVTSGEESPGERLARVIRSKDGYVSTYSDVPSLESPESPILKHRRHDSGSKSMETIPKEHMVGSNGAIYSMVDKSKKSRRSESSSPSKSPVYSSLSDKYVSEPNLKESSKKVKRRLFGAKLKDVEESQIHEEENGYHEIRGKGYFNGDSRKLTEEDYFSDGSVITDDESKIITPRSVIREMDTHKKEISYENVPHQDFDKKRGLSTPGALWFRRADEDYRRDLLSSDAYNSGTHVGTENGNGYSATLNRPQDKKREVSPNYRSYSLDRKAGRNSRLEQTSPVTYLNPLSNEIVIEDEVPVRQHHRGGLAAAYLARQRAAMKVRDGVMRENSPVRPQESPSRDRNMGSSAASAVSSSDSETAHRRKTLVMFIPGISHPERKAEDDDERMSGINVARSQSMLAAKPHKYRNLKKSRTSKKANSRDPSPDVRNDHVVSFAEDANKQTTKEDKESVNEKKTSADIKRRNSMPKDTKFGWLKFKKKAK